jgi:hypothetical protein
MTYVYIFLYILATFATTVTIVRNHRAADLNSGEVMALSLFWPVCLIFAIGFCAVETWIALAKKVANR